jgi:hypothetical protein
VLWLTILKELVTIDNDVKTKFNQYNGVKTNLATLQRKQTYVTWLLGFARLPVPGTANTV